MRKRYELTIYLKAGDRVQVNDVINFQMEAEKGERISHLRVSQGERADTKIAYIEKAQIAAITARQYEVHDR